MGEVTDRARLEQFAADAARSGLVPPAEMARARERLAAESPAGAANPQRLAQILVAQGTLTPYQARKLLAGQTRGFFLGGYRILRRLGQGGMGKVYLARREADGQRVAIKVLPPKRALEDEQVLRRFQREMDLSRRVRHPNLARTLDVGAEGDIHFMVMEFIPGDSLYNLVRDEARGWGRLRVPDAARLFLKVLDGLQAAHEAGLIHRDLKPSNIMVTPDGEAKILDLGLARALGDENPLTRPNTVIGTLDYASPEQLSDAARADARSDLYSLGCTIYFAVAGRPPFEGGDVVNKIFKQRMVDAEPLEAVAGGVPAAFAAIVRKLMAKDPAERYQTAAELKGDLARWVDPARVRAILGAEAESARAFRPPPPQLEEEDLRLLDDEGPSAIGAALRELGDGGPRHAPMYRPPPPPRPAVVVPPGTNDRAGAGLPPRAGESGFEETPWVLRVAVVACLLGAVAILVVAFLMNA